MSPNRNFLRPLVCSALLVLSACQASRQPSWAPVQTDDASAALSAWRARAHAGDADAQYTLGLLYERGVLVQEDLGRAEHWYVLSAAQQHPLAMERLEPDMPLRGDRADEVRPIAATASLGSAEQGAWSDEPRGYRDQLASLRLIGHGISRDPEVAFCSWPASAGD